MIAEGVLTKTIPGDLIDRFEVPEGTRVKIARIINTPIGLRFRIINTTRWIPQDSINCDFDHNLIVDYVKIANENRNRKLTQSGDGFNSKGYKPDKEFVRTDSVSRRRHGKQGRTKTMDKKDLKDAIVALTTGDRVSVTFLSTMPGGASNTRYDGIRGFAGKTVEATLVETKKGRGKGGSQLMVLKTDDGENFTTGTPHSDVILNFTTPAGMVGHESEADAPKSFETNAGQAAELKEQFKNLVGTVGATVRVQSTESEYTGDFTVTEVEQLRGRHGQIRLHLQGDDGRNFTLWSYRHSGVVTSFEVLTEGTTQSASTSTEAA